MEDAKVENSVCNVIPVTEYDPFEAKFAASLFWLVFRATEDGEFENIPSQVTSPIQRDSEKRITVRPEVTEFLTKGEIYCQVCNSIFHGKAPVVGQWAVLQTLSRHGFYVVEEGDIAVTDSALQQKKPFRKSTHLALMDCLMNAFSAQAVSVPEVVQCVSKFSSFNASKELPFDLEDALLLWINKISTVLNENQLKKQKHHAEQLLQNQDKAKRFRFRRDQLQPKVQTVFPLMEELLKDISNGKSLLGILMFYHPTVINIEDVRLEKNLATGDCVHNLDLFRSLCSQFICTSVLALKVEDLLYGSQAMKPNVIALLAEVFQKCKVESMSENFVVSKQTSKSDADLRHILANKEDVTDTKCSSAPVLNSDESKYAYGGARGSLKSKIERSSSLSGKLTGSALDAVKQEDSFVKKLQSDGQLNSNSRLSFKSSFHLDFTDDYNGQQPPLNGSLPNQGDEKDNERVKEKENPFTGILQRPVLAGDARKHGSPHTTPRQEVPLLMRRNKQKQRTLDLEDWDMQQGVGVVEDKSILQRYLQELHLNDLQRSQSLTGLDKAKVEPRQSFHAWQEDTVASLSDTNLASSRGERISLDFRPNPTASVPQRSIEGGAPQRGSQGTHVPMKSSKATGEEYTSQDSLLSSPKSTDCLNMKPLGDQLTERRSSLPTGVRDRDVRDIDVRYRDVRDSCMSDISTKELKQFEEIEAMILEGRSVETPRRFEKPSKLPYASESQDDDDELNMSVSSEDMNKFRLEVMQRLTEDKLREIPDGPVIEMEDDDDPIMLARNNAASSPGNPTERTRLDAPDMPKEVPTDQLSPITEATEPCPSIASNPNSASNSTAPSSPCSPLDVAPFMPAFFTTSPANTLDRKMQRFSLKDRDNTLVANEDEDEDDGFFGNPEPSATPRFNKSGDCSSRSKSFEQLTRGSYTVGHVPVETAKAAGIPVINASTEETRPRADSNPELNGVLPGGKLSQKETDASQDLSAFRPYVLSSNEDEMGEMFAPEGVDGRRDSLETSPAHSPAPAIIRGKRDDTRPEAVLRSRDLHALDSPGDVVIFERSLSSSHETRENAPTENSKEQGNESAQTHSTSVHRSKKAEAFVFDFDQGVVQNYENNLATQDYGTYKKGKHGSIGDGNTSMKGNQVLNRSQGDHFATFSRNSPRGTQDHRPPSEQQQELAFSREGSVGMKDLRASDGFSTYRKNSLPEKKANDANGVSGTVGRSWDLRRSDGYSTFRKESMPSSAESTLAKYNMAFIQGQRGNDTDPFSTFAKSAQRLESNQHRHQVELNHFPEQESTSAVFRGPTSSREGESEIDTVPRGGDEEPVRSPGASNILRSRTFRKTSSGQIVEDVSVGARSSPVHNELRSSTKNDSKPTGQQTVNTHIRNSSEGTGSDNPHRISWTDDQEAGARLIKQLNASKEMSENNDSGSPRRRGSPRHTGRGSPGARISWLTAARSGVGGQVMLNDKDRMQKEATTELATDEKSHGRPCFIATAVILPKHMRNTEGTPWSVRENGAKDEPVGLGQRAGVRFDPEDDACVVESGSLLKNIGATRLDGDCSSSKEIFKKESNMFHGETSLEADVQTGGSIRDRIAALKATSGMKTLAVTPERELAKKPFTKPAVRSHEDEENEENEENETMKADLRSESPKSIKVLSKRETQSEMSQVSPRNSIAFNVGLQNAAKSRLPPRLLARFKTDDSEARKEEIVSESSAVNNKEIGAVRDKVLAFEVNFDDEPRSKRVKDEAFLMQSPFKALKTRSNLRRQQNSKPCKPIRAQEDLEDNKTSELPKLLKRNTFTLDSVSDQGSPIVKVLDELASKEEGKQNGEVESGERGTKRNTFTLESVFLSKADITENGQPVINLLNDSVIKKESDQSEQETNITTSLSNEMSQKRSTFTLESVAIELDSAIGQEEQGVKQNEAEKFHQGTITVDTLTKQTLTSEEELVTSEKRSTYNLDAVSSSLQRGTDKGALVVEVLNQLAKREKLQSSVWREADSSPAAADSVKKRGTFTLNSVSQTLDDEEKKGVSTVEVLDQLAFEQESTSSTDINSGEKLHSKTSQNRGTFTLDSVSQTLEDAECKGLPTVEALDRLASEQETHLLPNASCEDQMKIGPPQNRGTYSLDSVSHAIEEAVEKGILVSVTLNHLAQEGTNHAHAHGDASFEPRPFDAEEQPPDDRDEIEARFEDALETLEDCLTFVSFPSASDRRRSYSDKRQSFTDRNQSSNDRAQLSSDQERSSEAPRKRGTYNLDDVSNSVEVGAKVGIPVIETLEQLSKTKNRQGRSFQETRQFEQNRRTYTLDEVSFSLQNASAKGIPVVEALQNMTKTTELARGTEDSAQKRGTYTLDDVSKSLERAKSTGMPVIEALESLSKEMSPSSLRLKIPERGGENRGTYTLDEVSQTLEKAKQRGLPVVDALGQLTYPKDVVSLRGTPDAVHRRQEKLVNRKTYALASPLETIGEGTKLRLYDGSQRQMLSPLSIHMKTEEATQGKENSSESKAKGLGVVQKLDFLTSACELLLEANAKEMARDRVQTTLESSRETTTIDESLRTLPKTSKDGKESDRRTYSLDNISQTIDDATAVGTPVVEALKSVTPEAKAKTIYRTNLMRLNSKSDSELIHDETDKKSSERSSHSLEDMSDAKKAGIPVIQALDQLAKDLVEFSKTALGEDVKIVSVGKENRKRKRHSEVIDRGKKTPVLQSPHPFAQASPDSSSMRKAHSLNDIASAVQLAFQTGTSLTDLLNTIASEKLVEQVSSSSDVRPRSVDSGFISSLSDYDISSQSVDSPRNRSNTFILDSSNEELDLVKLVGPELDTKSNENRRTFTLDHVSGSVEHEVSRGVPVIEALKKLSNNSELKMQRNEKIKGQGDTENKSTEMSDKTAINNSVKKKSPPKPKRQISKKTASPQTDSDAFVVEFYSSSGQQGQNTSKFQVMNDKVEEVITNDDESNFKNSDGKVEGSEEKSDDTSSSLEKVPKSKGLKPVSTSAPSRERATWRPSGSVLDNIESLMDAAGDCGLSPSDILDQVTDLPCDFQGEIEEPEQNEAEEEQAVTSQIAYLRMQLEEKRRHIEAEKHRAQAEWEDQRRRLGQTAFWYVIGKAQGGPGVGEGTGNEAVRPEKVPVMTPHSHETPRKPVSEFPTQSSPPVAWSSPANSPLPANALESNPPNGAGLETREFRLSDYPPFDNQGTARPSSQPAVKVGSRPTPGPPRPASHEPAASRPSPTRKCWDVNVGLVPTPSPLVHPDAESDAKEDSNNFGGTGEIEVEVHTPQKKGMAMFISDDDNPAPQGLTPEQQRKRERFMKARQKKQAEEKTRKEAELEKKRRREEKQREKEMLLRLEEERLRQEEIEQRKAEQELRLKEAQAHPARIPDSYATYRRPGPQQHVYDVNDDTSTYLATAPSQLSGFAEFSGPQCYVKPSGKSNRKIIVNAISHVCLSGTVNQDQKEKCLQAISENDGHHFMILFKDGLKFRGIYVHNLENDQLFKIFGIGPRVITNKMIESLYKYNSGGKEFTKIPSKTLSISVDGFAIQKSCWNTGKPVVQSKTSSNLKRPPRPPQR